MKNLLFILLFLSSQLFSQIVKTAKDFEVEIGKAYPVVDAPIKEYFYYKDEILSIKIGGKITIQKFNANALDEKSRKEIATKDNLPKEFEHEEFVHVGDKIFHFYNVWDKLNEIEQIFVQEISFRRMDLENNRLISKISGKVQSYMGKDKIDIYDSFDRSKFLMTYRKHPKFKNDKVNKDVIGMTVFNGDMNVIWEKEITMPYTEDMMDNLVYTVDSKGNAYLLARVSIGGKPRLELLKYNNSDKPEITEIKADGKSFPHKITLKEGKNGIIYCVGFFSKGSFANVVNVVYISFINASGKITNEQFHDIPLEIINQNISERKQEKNEIKEDIGKEVGIYELGLDDIVFNEDGSFILLGEVFYITTAITSSPNGSITTHTRNYLEMFMAKLTAEGEISWMKKLPKSQKYTTNKRSGDNGPDLSYKYMSTGKDHYLLYLDNINNLSLPLNEYPATHYSGKGGFLTAYKINDASGDVSKLSLFDLNDVKGIPVFKFATSRIVQPNDKEIILELYKKQKQDILLRINLR